MIPEKLKNFALSVDGRGYVGKCKTVTPPKLSLKTEEYRGGGMDAPIEHDMGMEKLEMDYSLPSIDAELIGQFGIEDISGTSVTLRGAYQDDQGVNKPVVINANGRIKEVDPGSWEAGGEALNKYMMSLTYYKLTVDGEVIIEIDVINMKRVINGTDVLQAQRDALGI